MKTRSEHIDPHGTVYIETRGVNGNILTEEVIIYTIETLTNTYAYNYIEEHDRSIVINYLEHFFNVMMEAKYIEQFDIIFDNRNNMRSDMNMGKFAIELKFKQRNCLNFTSVKFLLGGKK